MLDPVHNPDDGGPRMLGVRPSYGIYIRNVDRLVIDGLTLSFESNDDRPALIVDSASDVTLSRSTLERGEHINHDLCVGVNVTGLRVTDSGVIVKNLTTCRESGGVMMSRRHLAHT